MGAMGCLVGECEIEGSEKKCANGYAAYTDNKLAWVRGESACLRHCLSPISYLHSSPWTVPVNWQRSNERQKEWERAEKREECNLLTPSLKEPFTCVDTLEWLEGLSANWEKSWREEEERKEKSNKSDWYSPPLVGQNARCNVNHDALTVHLGWADITPPAVSALWFGQSSHPEAQAQRLMFIQNRSTYFSYTTSERDTLTLVKLL